ncbi:hypothetical protein [Legionella feeleii]|uniref:Uncharacterized protein n=1 Tax=Legionella feeleii TaxID=453 RepID=A0A2X1QR80_9GAMM|nr:hypothetical protein [Legionella feeleii]SPX60697.1 Uncharacterised protein [Legionella feeleii]
MKWHNQVGWVATQLAIRESRTMNAGLISKNFINQQGIAYEMA